jgi:hypothetical protein
MIALPEQPWQDGDTFTNDETGVKYTFDGEKWLAGGGAEADDATLALINDVDRTSQMRDEILDGKIDQESALNTAAHLRMEQQIIRIGTWSESDDDKVREEFAAADAELQKQIDAIEIPETDLSGYVPKTESWDMALGTSLGVNVLKNLDGGTPFVYYDGDPDGTHPCGLVNRGMMRDYVSAEIGKAPQTSQPMSAKLMVGFQLWTENRLAEGCFNLLDADKNPTSKIKNARFLTFHIIQDWDHVEWFKHDLRGKGQIHLTDLDGKYQMSKFVTGAEKHYAATGTNPDGALWFFELEEFGHDPDLTLSGNYFIDFDSCLKESS